LSVAWLGIYETASSFTVFFAALGGLISVSFGFFEIKSGNPENIKLAGKIGGLLITILFFYYALRIQSLINHSFMRGREIESLLQYKHLLNMPWGKYRSYHATRAFFVILIGFWLWVLFLSMK
jgi:hypothetical protein